MQLKEYKIKDLKQHPDNYNGHPENQLIELEKSLSDFEQYKNIVVWNGLIIAGNGLFLAAQRKGLKTIWAVDKSELSEEKALALLAADNATPALSVPDIGKLELILDKIDFDIPGVTDDFLKGMNIDLNLDNQEPEKEPTQPDPIKLQDKFIIPPFSILDTRQGYWQDRKKTWKSLICDNGESRETSMQVQDREYKSKKNLQTGFKTVGQEVSLLDPVLAEIVNKWFGLSECKTFDCFAGDSVFGFVSDYLGNEFTGIELRQEQTDLNNSRLTNKKSKYICDDGQNVLHHIKENSQDLLFSCPPYFDLEKYSDLPNDASNQKKLSRFFKDIG